MLNFNIHELATLLPDPYTLVTKSTVASVHAALSLWVAYRNTNRWTGQWTSSSTLILPYSYSSTQYHQAGHIT